MGGMRAQPIPTNILLRRRNCEIWAWRGSCRAMWQLHGPRSEKASLGSRLEGEAAPHAVHLLGKGRPFRTFSVGAFAAALRGPIMARASRTDAVCDSSVQFLEPAHLDLTDWPTNPRGHCS